jgi:hypothetical protein
MGSRVSGISFDAATGLMLGKVRGGADVPYSTTAKLVRKAGGWSCTVGVCSCPVRKDCKHVAALLFAAEDNPATRVQLLSPGTATQTSREPAVAVSDWEKALSPLISQPGTAPSTNGVPLALQFEVEEPAPHFSYTGRRDPLRSVRQLKARPVIMGTKGKWDPRRRLLEHPELPELPPRVQRIPRGVDAGVPGRPLRLRRPDAELLRPLAGFEHLLREEPVEPAVGCPEDRAGTRSLQGQRPGAARGVPRRRRPEPGPLRHPRE